MKKVDSIMFVDVESTQVCPSPPDKGQFTWDGESLSGTYFNKNAEIVFVLNSALISSLWKKKMSCIKKQQKKTNKIL